MAGLSLMAYSAGLPGFMLIKVLAPAFYSRKDPRTPVRIAVIALVTNMVLNLVFVVPMVHFGVSGPHAGLALATSVAAWVNAGLLYHTLRQKGIYRPEQGWMRLGMQALLAGGVLAAVLLWAVPGIDDWLAWGAGQRILQLLGWVAAGVVAYFVALRLAGLRLLVMWRQGRQ